MADIDIRAVDPDGEPAVRRVVCDAFSSDAEYALIEALRHDGNAWVPELSLGAYARGDLVAHILFTHASVGGVSAVLLAPLAVAPDRQKQGFGGMLVVAGLEVARAQGAVIALVLGHPSYYPRFGFEPAIPHGILPLYDVEPAEAWMATALVPGALEIVRGTVSLAEAFSDPAMWVE